MQQHPVPQNITAFEFKLVGFMTLRQFSYVAAAGILSFVFFITGGGGITRWFFIVPISLLGIGLAFLPVGGVSFDKWIVLFLHYISSPTKRVWRKEPKEISFLAPQFSRYLRRPPVTIYSPEANRAILEAYLAKLKPEGAIDRMANIEATRINLIDFGSGEKFSAIWTRKPEPGDQKPVFTPSPAPPEAGPTPLGEALRAVETVPIIEESAPDALKEFDAAAAKVAETQEEVLKEYSGLATTGKRRGF